ncbi:hypothetical protein GCM10011571_17300 [Marinithermofilum abyssi]|uniref:Lipoprotein n=1 Tax=Marinithermofilum abyssi TaxID=1571185 RepID=A0A8J2VHG6_9BACL|nr:hypothetical protein [Marinithermofilum abyssi]GGE16187.1 hypothetical protein GCM10011571_17300 [Marinithermofilum abyssi]
MNIRWIGLAGLCLSVFLVAAACTESASAPEKPKGPKLTPGEQTAIDFYKARYVEGDSKKVKRLLDKKVDWLKAVGKSPNKPISIQPYKGKTLTHDHGTYIILTPKQTYITVEVSQASGKWQVTDFDSIDQFEVNQVTDEGKWKKVKQP